MFKVVQCGQGDDDFSRLVTGKAQVRYRIGNWAQAPGWLREKGYHLLAFLDYSYAYDFVSEIPDGGGGVILKAEAIGVIHDIPIRCEREMLALGKLVPKPKPDLVWPAGTIMCEKLKPTGIVKVVHGSGIAALMGI